MKTEFEKKVIIKMRRLKKNRCLFEKMQEELKEVNDKETARKFIEADAIDNTIKEVKEKNA